MKDSEEGRREGRNSAIQAAALARVASHLLNDGERVSAEQLQDYSYILKEAMQMADHAALLLRVYAEEAPQDEQPATSYETPTS